jgi:hypothetical protein
MPCPRTFAELIAKTWPSDRDVFLVESYLASIAAERGEDWMTAPPQPKAAALPARRR